MKTIYSLGGAQRAVSTTELASALQVSPASATNMIKKLTSMKLLRYSRYRGVELTSRGEKIALEVIRHHRLVELFLNETLGVPWDRVHAEAEKIEHVLSEELEDRIDAKLGSPSADPHGDPIPTKSGKLPAGTLERLIDWPVGRQAVVRRVGAQDPPHLRYLGGLGLTPNAHVEILEQAPFGGPLRLRVGNAEHMLDETFARLIWVSSDAPHPLRPHRRRENSN